jgi:release factor glutamine methyltransferase
MAKDSNPQSEIRNPQSSEGPWTIGRLLKWTADYLAQHGADSPRLDAEVLLAHARRCQRIDLYAAYDEEVDEAARATFRDLVRRRATGTPVAYLVGHREFYALDFEVTPDVLIPRPETELLVVALSDHVKQRLLCAGLPTPHKSGRHTGDGVARSGDRLQQEKDRPQQTIAIADVGTGSGILAVCAAKYVGGARVTAIDVSPAALEVARRNAARHGVAERIEFVQSNLFANVLPDVCFDYIVSNPPYVTTAEMAELPGDVREHEPHVALDAGEEGTTVIAPLIKQAAERLYPGGVLLVEVSPMIAGRVEDLVRSQATFELGPTIRDPAGHARVVQATRRTEQRIHHRDTESTEEELQNAR